MRLLTWVPVSVCLCVLAEPAWAAKITIGDQGGFVDVGVIAQTWVRVAENGATDHAGPSFDIYLRRMRIYVNGAVNAHFGIISNTDVSYTQGTITNATGVITNPETAQNVVRFSSPTIVLNEALGYWAVCPEFIFQAGLQLLPWVRQTATDITKFSALDEQGDVTERGRPTGFFGRNRDMGLVVRGLLFNNRIDYRVGVFNGVQSFAGSSVYTASGFVSAGSNKLGAPVADVYYAPYGAVNPGDSPSFDGLVRINFLGYEPDYSLLGIAYNGKAYFAIGGGVNYQPRAIPPTGRTVSFNSYTASYEGYFADLHLDLPFGNDLAYELVVEAGWVRTVYSGNGAPVDSKNAAGLALVNNAGNGYYGTVGMRFGIIYPYFAFEDYQSNLSPSSVNGVTYLATYGSTAGVPAGLVGNLTTYHVGLKFFISPPPGNQFMIDLEMAFQNKESPANPAAPVSGNQWYGTVEFQFKI